MVWQSACRTGIVGGWSSEPPSTSLGTNASEVLKSFQHPCCLVFNKIKEGHMNCERMWSQAQSASAICHLGLGQDLLIDQGVRFSSRKQRRRWSSAAEPDSPSELS